MNLHDLIDQEYVGVDAGLRCCMLESPVRARRVQANVTLEQALGLLRAAQLLPLSALADFIDPLLLATHAELMGETRRMLHRCRNGELPGPARFMKLRLAFWHHFAVELVALRPHLERALAHAREHELISHARRLLSREDPTAEPSLATMRLALCVDTVPA